VELTQIAAMLVKPVVPARVWQWRTDRYFFSAQGWQNLHLGKFTSFPEANEFASRRGVQVGYRLDHSEWGQIQATIKVHDYPVLYWLGRLLEKDSVLCDFGGSVGVCYYAYGERLQFPEGLSWVVCELPEPVALGAQLAIQRKARGLSFTTDRAAMDGCQVLLAAGVLPFLEQRLPNLLGGLAHPPRHILINRLPLCREIPAYVTLQNTGHSVTPMRIDNHAQFIDDMEQSGYELVDSWKCFENSLRVPQHPECEVRHFHGFCFRHRQAVQTTVAAGDAGAVLSA
jgi:putative methyltransferase (TIGR04325 family)